MTTAQHHPHSSELARGIAERGTILRVQVGSGAARDGRPRAGRPRRDTGRITLPIPEPELTDLRAVRRGEWTLADVLTWAQDLEAQLSALAETSPLSADPDEDWVNDWLHRAYTRFWSAG